MMFFTGGYLRVLSFYDHLDMMEKAQHLGDVVSAGMFQMVTVFTVRPQTAWQVEGRYQEVSFCVLVHVQRYMLETFLFNIEYSIWPMLLYCFHLWSSTDLFCSTDWYVWHQSPYIYIVHWPQVIYWRLMMITVLTLVYQNWMKSYIPFVVGRLKNCVVFIKQKIFVWSLLQDCLDWFTWLVDSDCFCRALYNT